MLGLTRVLQATTGWTRGGPAEFVRTMKTRKSAASRWWMTGSGDFLRKQAGRRHGNVGWSRARIIRHLNGTVPAAPTLRHKKLRVLLPFAKK